MPNYPLNPLPLGKLTVAAAGTPIQFNANCSAFYSATFYNTGAGGVNGPEDAWVSILNIRTNPNNAGNVYIGTKTKAGGNMNKTTGEGVIMVLSKSDPPQRWDRGEGCNKWRVGDLFVDADNSGDSIFASVEIWG